MRERGADQAPRARTVRTSSAGGKSRIVGFMQRCSPVLMLPWYAPRHPSPPVGQGSSARARTVEARGKPGAPQRTAPRPRQQVQPTLPAVVRWYPVAATAPMPPHNVVTAFSVRLAICSVVSEGQQPHRSITPSVRDCRSPGEMFRSEAHVEKDARGTCSVHRQSDPVRVGVHGSEERRHVDEPSLVIELVLRCRGQREVQGWLQKS